MTGGIVLTARLGTSVSLCNGGCAETGTDVKVGRSATVDPRRLLVSLCQSTASMMNLSIRTICIFPTTKRVGNSPGWQQLPRCGSQQEVSNGSRRDATSRLLELAARNMQPNKGVSWWSDMATRPAQAGQSSAPSQLGRIKAPGIPTQPGGHMRIVYDVGVRW
jgi:hypothetical protein